MRLRVSSSTTVGEFLRSQGVKPRSALKRAFVEKKIFLNGHPVARTANCYIDDEIEIRSDSVFLQSDTEIKPNTDLPLEVLLESRDYLIVNKPAGQNAHPLKPTETNTTLNAIVAHNYKFATTRHAATLTTMSRSRVAAAHNPESTLIRAGALAPALDMRTKYGSREGGLLHRLDRGTSGVLVCARTVSAFEALRRQWSKTEKLYLAWCHGRLTFRDTIELYLAHDPHSPKRMRVVKSHKDGWLAVTSVFPVHHTDDATLVLVCIHTGVTHQIRVTLAHLGHPVIGDTTYSGAPHTWPDLPKNAFLLHALFFRCADIPDLSKGVVAPIPEYFGISFTHTTKAAQRLIRLGGSDPNAKAPPRNKYWSKK